MPADPVQIDHPLSSAERKTRLVLACMADRLAWCHACQPQPPPPTQLASQVLELINPLLAFLPRRISRWLRGAHLLAKMNRQFHWF